MTTLEIEYGTKTVITLGLETSPLASSATFVDGRESTEIDNTSNKFIDALLQGKVTVGTTPTANRTIKIYVWGSDVAPSSTALDVLDGADSDETLTNTGILYSLLKLAHAIPVLHTTTAITYYMPPTSIKELFGGSMPKYWGLFVTHNTGVDLHATGSNHEFTYTGIKYTNT